MYPRGGVLVEAPVERVRQLMASLGERFDARPLLYRTSRSWTAVFNMEPGSTADDAAVVILSDNGFVPVYHFDFNRFEYFTWRWDGNAWVEDDDPENVLSRVGIEVPGMAK